MRKRNLATFIACLLTFGPARADPPDPLRRLGEMLGDPARTEVVLVALRSTGDKHLEPLLVALARSPDPARRAFAVAGLAEICGKDSAPVLRK